MDLIHQRCSTNIISIHVFWKTCKYILLDINILSNSIYEFINKSTNHEIKISLSQSKSHIYICHDVWKLILQLLPIWSCLRENVFCLSKNEAKIVLSCNTTKNKVKNKVISNYIFTWVKRLLCWEKIST